MKNPYYTWWADSIIRIRHFNPNMNDWKMKVFTLNTLLNSINLAVLVIWLNYLNILKIPILETDVFPGDVLDTVFSYIIQFATPFILLNYFLIFHKNRYEKIIPKYKDKKLNIAFPYAIVSASLFAITVIVYAVFWS